MGTGDAYPWRAIFPGVEVLRADSPRYWRVLVQERWVLALL
jgi:hypothetical protein